MQKLTIQEKQNNISGYNIMGIVIGTASILQLTNYCLSFFQQEPPVNIDHISSKQLFSFHSITDKNQITIF